MLSTKWFKLSVLAAVFALIASVLLVGNIAAMEKGKKDHTMEMEKGKKGHMAGSRTIPNLTIQVEGMKCSECKQALKAALEGVPGVQTATADLKAKTAQIVLEKGKAIDLIQLKQAVAEIETLTLKQIELMAAGQIVSWKDRSALKTNGSGQTFILLENSLLEELESIIQPEKEEEVILTGIATLYKGKGYLLISKYEKSQPLAKSEG